MPHSHQLGYLHHLTGDPTRGEAALKDALAHALALGEPRGELEIRETLAGVMADQGRLVEAREQIALALDMARNLKDPELQAPALNGSASVDRRSGHLDDAEHGYLDAARRADEASDRYVKAIALIGLGQVRLDQGRPGEGLTLVQEAREIASRIGYRLIEADALLVAGRLEAALGRVPAAEGSVRTSIALARECGCVWALVRGLLALANPTELERAEAADILARLGISAETANA